MLIKNFGRNMLHLHFLDQNIKAKNIEPWENKTEFECTMSRPLPKDEVCQRLNVSFVATDDDSLAEQLKTRRDVEFYAAKCNLTGQSKEDRRALGLLPKATNLLRERYEVGLLWRDYAREIPINFTSALFQFMHWSRVWIEKQWESTLHREHQRLS